MTDTANLGDIVVVGVRRKKNTDVPNYDEEVTVNPDTGEPGGGGGFSDLEIDAENARQRDCAGAGYHQALQGISTRNSKEHFSFVLNRGGNTSYTTPAPGTGDVITGADRAAVMQQHNIQYSEIEGFAHNHPSGPYCNQPGMSLQERSQAVDINSYPSLGDWSYADGIVAQNPSIASTFTLYVTGCDNVLRSFPYTNRDYFRQQVQRANPPRPPALQTDCN